MCVYTYIQLILTQDRYLIQLCTSVGTLDIGTSETFSHFSF